MHDLIAKYSRSDLTKQRVPKQDGVLQVGVGERPFRFVEAPSLMRKATCACGGGCPACQARSSDLRVSQPNDPAEIEADQIADRVMRMPDSETESAAKTQNSTSTINRKCSTCEDEKKTIQRKALPSGGGVAAQSPAHVQSAISSGGQPLDRQTRSFFESRFQYDFSGVRVHTDANAEQSAKAIKALAYTVGKHIVFGENQYRPESETGKALMAHELVHTTQQSGQINRQEDMDAGVSEPRDADVPIAGVPEQPAPEALPTPEPATPQRQNICGPDITSALSAVYSRIEAFFRPLSWFEKRRSCMALDVDAPLAFVNPIMAWDTRELFLPNTSFLDSYFTASGCGSPRDGGCPTDPTRHLCETSGTCGNSVIVGGKCMLAGTANYGTYGKMFRLCNDEFSPDFPRWDMRAMINLYKTISFDDPEPPREMATAVFDGTFPSVPAVTENRAYCTGRCGRTHSGSFDFIWEPYHTR